jgi:hypothetical protein
MKSDHLRTSGGMPSLRGSFSLMKRAKSSAVCSERVSMGSISNLPNYYLANSISDKHTIFPYISICARLFAKKQE